MSNINKGDVLATE